MPGFDDLGRDGVATVSAQRHRGARSMACARCKTGLAIFAAGRQNALKKRRFSTQLNSVNLRVFSVLAN
jgi:hypothetical protein